MVLRKLGIFIILSLIISLNVVGSCHFDEDHESELIESSHSLSTSECDDHKIPHHNEGEAHFCHIGHCQSTVFFSSYELHPKSLIFSLSSPPYKNNYISHMGEIDLPPPSNSKFFHLVLFD